MQIWLLLPLLLSYNLSQYQSIDLLIQGRIPRSQYLFHTYLPSASIPARLGSLAMAVPNLDKPLDLDDATCPVSFRFPKEKVFGCYKLHC